MTEVPGDHAPEKRRIPVDSFAHRLMLARAHAGHISIREAAELTGLGRGAWTHWEKGGMPVDLDYVIEVISEKLDVDPLWLLNGGALAEPETRSRRMRWSTVRPHRTSKKGEEAGQATQGKLTPTGRRRDEAERPMSDRPRDARPNGRPTKSGPKDTSRRPVLLRPASRQE